LNVCGIHVAINTFNNQVRNPNRDTIKHVYAWTMVEHGSQRRLGKIVRMEVWSIRR
jgi:hypothetical protein